MNRKLLWLLLGVAINIQSVDEHILRKCREKSLECALSCLFVGTDLSGEINTILTEINGKFENLFIEVFGLATPQITSLSFVTQRSIAICYIYSQLFVTTETNTEIQKEFFTQRFMRYQYKTKILQFTQMRW